MPTCVLHAKVLRCSLMFATAQGAGRMGGHANMGHRVLFDDLLIRLVHHVLPILCLGAGGNFLVLQSVPYCAKHADQSLVHCFGACYADCQYLVSCF